MNDSDAANFVINTTAIVADAGLSIVSTNPPTGSSGKLARLRTRQIMRSLVNHAGQRHHSPSG